MTAKRKRERSYRVQLSRPLKQALRTFPAPSNIAPYAQSIVFTLSSPGWSRAGSTISPYTTFARSTPVGAALDCSTVVKCWEFGRLISFRRWTAQLTSTGQAHRAAQTGAPFWSRPRRIHRGESGLTTRLPWLECHLGHRRLDCLSISNIRRQRIG